ncbi:MAG: DUF4190 domain-containing protein [Nocardioidaceae bacterium]|nr:DUF4190 domain-containing protein [Nocardioidaceae bacterium]
MSYTPPPPGGNDQPPGGGYGGGYPPPPPGGEYGGGYGQPAGSSQKATWALVTGIIGLCIGPVGIAAIVLGQQAKGEIAASGGALGGSGKAQAGFILGIVAVVAWLLLLFLRIAG